MTPTDVMAFDAGLSNLLAARDGPGVAAVLPRDPLQREALGFIRWLGEVESTSVEAAYTRPRAVIAARVTAGRVADVKALFKLLWGVQKRLALHHDAKDRRAGRPGVTRLAPNGFVRPPVAADTELEPPTGREPAPAVGLDRRELFRVMLAEARWLGVLRLQVFRAVKRFERDRRTMHGAYRAAARRAVLDGRGRVTKLRPVAVDEGDMDEPAERVVRQVRRMYREACRYIDNRAYFRGYRVRPLS